VLAAGTVVLVTGLATAGGVTLAAGWTTWVAVCTTPPAVEVTAELDACAVGLAAVGLAAVEVAAVEVAAVEVAAVVGAWATGPAAAAVTVGAGAWTTVTALGAALATAAGADDSGAV